MTPDGEREARGSGDGLAPASERHLGWLGAIMAADAVVQLGLLWGTAALALGAVLVATLMPVPGVGLAPLEVAAVLALPTLAGAWAVGRTLHALGVRHPWIPAILTCGIVLVIGLAVPPATGARLDWRCDRLGGLALEPDEGRDGRTCQVGGVPGNPYLPGREIRTAWDGRIPPVTLVVLLGVAAIASTRLAGRRLWSPRAQGALNLRLRRVPAAGPRGVPGGLADFVSDRVDGPVVACGQFWPWGELCGQLYRADADVGPHTVCARCGQPVVPARPLTLRVVAPRTVDLGMLDDLALENARWWTVGEAPPLDPGRSTQEAWVELGRLDLPDGLTVAQTLAFVFARLSDWGGAGAALGSACGLASRLGSTQQAWLWAGESRVVGRPGAGAQAPLLVGGPMRLRDCLPGHVDAAITLELDLGVFPVEVLVGDSGGEAGERVGLVECWIPLSRARGDRPAVECAEIERRILEQGQRAVRRGGLEAARLGGRPDALMCTPDRTGVRPGTPPPWARLSSWDRFEGRDLQLLRRHCVTFDIGEAVR